VSEATHGASRAGKDNPMKEVRVVKVTINIGVGESAEKLVKAEKVLELVTGKKPIRTISKATNKDLGIRLDQPIGAKVTLRGKTAEEFMTKAIWTKDNKLAGYSFDQDGNFSFGVPEYTDMPGMKYDPNVGIFGFDVCVVLGRRGDRITKRSRTRAKVGRTHKLNPTITKQFITEKFKIELIE